MKDIKVPVQKLPKSELKLKLYVKVKVDVPTTPTPNYVDSVV